MTNKIIDSHFHFWDTDLLDYTWLDEVPAINRPFLPADFAQATEKNPVSGKIFVEAGGTSNQTMAEVEWVSALAKQDDTIKAIVAFIPLEFGDRAAGAIEALTRFPLVKGVRRVVQSEPLGFCVQPEFVHGVKLLANHNFSFDICVKHHQMDDVLTLVEQCSNVQFVLDHIGKPDIANGLLDPWRGQISRLAKHENVACKLSGLVTEADHANWQPADLRPYIDHVLEAFGPNRLMFGSDWPVCTLASSYQRWINLAFEYTAELNESERDQIFYQTAVDFYRL